MNRKITVIDYGLGNLFSVKKALEYSGASNVVVSSKARDLQDAEFAVLPGVGAFADGMRGLHEHHLIKPLLAYVATGRPLLGICLGMQLLASKSEEFGDHDGLDLISGRVTGIPPEKLDGGMRKVPFVGWAPLIFENRVRDSFLFNGKMPTGAVYLVHSYRFQCNDERNEICSYDCDGLRVTAAVQSENIFGVQFHPEKSGDVGIEILREFIGL